MEELFPTSVTRYLPRPPGNGIRLTPSLNWALYPTSKGIKGKNFMYYLLRETARLLPCRVCLPFELLQYVLVAY